MSESPPRGRRRIWRHSSCEDDAARDFLLSLVSKLKARDKFKFFHDAVDINCVPDYLDVVDVPMDFSEISSRVADEPHMTFEDFERLVLLVFTNCCAYNAPDTPFYKQAVVLRQFWMKSRVSFSIRHDQLRGEAEAKREPAFASCKVESSRLSRSASHASPSTDTTTPGTTLSEVCGSQSPPRFWDVFAALGTDPSAPLYRCMRHTMPSPFVPSRPLSSRPAEEEADLEDVRLALLAEQDLQCVGFIKRLIASSKST
eukprot:Polyplicarium_translucidae@DN1928_c0_g1_i1.p1